MYIPLNQALPNRSSREKGATNINVGAGKADAAILHDYFLMIVINIAYKSGGN